MIIEPNDVLEFARGTLSTWANTYGDLPSGEQVRWEFEEIVAGDGHASTNFMRVRAYDAADRSLVWQGEICLAAYDRAKPAAVDG